MDPTIPAPLTVHRLLVARFRHEPTHAGRLATTTGGEGAVAAVVWHHAGLLRLYFGSPCTYATGWSCLTQFAAKWAALVATPSLSFRYSSCALLLGTCHTGPFPQTASFARQ